MSKKPYPPPHPLGRCRHGLIAPTCLECGVESPTDQVERLRRVLAAVEKETGMDGNHCPGCGDSDGHCVHARIAALARAALGR